ncbi:putative serine threonine protein kinase [Rosellinia necatrix]|uniref:Putative serine threonine protein kinase n=1 Tax=Rosellinia necatrix TaxID=77044 RepID=A0A1S8A7B4_ROSNE|nr:putative serine threonine protein kinase [Rosellinia necatrix]
MRKRYDRAIADVLFELRVLSHRSFARHRSIPALLGFSLEQDDEFKSAGASGDVLRPALLLEWAVTDLNRYFLENQEQSPIHCARLVADITDGLQVMHTYGLSHADLKPYNMLLYTDASSAYGLVAKLSDFGFPGSGQHQLPVGGDTPHWGAPYREYTIDNTEYPGGVFLFGLVAMFVAVKGNWDFRLNGVGVKDVQTRQANIRSALRNHFGNPKDDLSSVSSRTWFRRWDELLSNTVTADPEDRLRTRGLGKVRQNITGR